MGLRSATFAFCALLAWSSLAWGQAEYRVYEDRPRLFLTADRLARLEKEAGRQSPLWQTFDKLAATGSSLPEPLLVGALRYRVVDDVDAGREAVRTSVRNVEDGIDTAAELREVSLVYDWCHALLEEQDQGILRDGLAAAVTDVLPLGNVDVGLLRAAVLASITLAGDWDGSESALAALLGGQWQSEIAPRVAQGDLSDDGLALVALLEMCIAVRHNLEIDLLRSAGDASLSLARTRLLSYFPQDISTAHGRARRPSFFGADEEAAGMQAPFYRIADLLLVAYQPNPREFQFLQGWLRDDRYVMRSAMMAPYEFLWLNRYLPGLTPQSAPLLDFDQVRGRLFGRSVWERPATWIGYADGSLQILKEGELMVSSSFEDLPPMFFPDAAVVPMVPDSRVVIDWQPNRAKAPETATIYLVGLDAGETYGLKVGSRPAKLVDAAVGGVIKLWTDPLMRKQNRIDLRKKVRIEVKRTLKPTAPGRAPPSLRR